MRVKPKRKRESEVERGKNNKILNGRVIATVYICTIIVVFVRKYTILHPLIWVFFFFLSKCVKCLTFSILKDYGTIDVVALKLLFQRNY